MFINNKQNHNQDTLMNFNQLLLELKYLQDYQAVRNHPIKGQSSFVFSLDDQASRIEYVLQQVYNMEVVFEFEVMLNVEDQTTQSTAKNIYLDEYQVDKFDSKEQYGAKVVWLLHTYFSDRAFTYIEKYYREWLKETQHSRSEYSIERWIGETIPIFETYVEYNDLDLKPEYWWVNWARIISLRLQDVFVDTMEPVKQCIEDTFKTDKVKVLNTYHAEKKLPTHWYIEQDGSLVADDEDQTPAEIVSPYVPVKNCFSVFKQFHDVMSKKFKVRTNETTGFHVNLVLKTPIDFAKLIIMTHDTVTLERFDRIFNEACESQYDLLEKYIASYAAENKPIIIGAISPAEDLLFRYFPKEKNIKQYEEYFKWIQDNPNKRIKTIEDAYIDFRLEPGDEYEISRGALVRKQPLDIEKDILPTLMTLPKFKGFMTKYRSINFLKYNNAKMIEFRIMGNDYLGRYYQETLKSLNWFIFMMAVASSSELYKDEYIEKIKNMLANN
jgi:hypothetical protein